MNIKSQIIRRVFISFALGVALSLNAQVFNVLHDFAGSPADGSEPGGVLLTNGMIFGTCSQGGINGGGMLFVLNAQNGDNFAVLHMFTNQPDGLLPNDLILSGTTLYGTTTYGGSSEVGTIYKIGTNGLGYTILRNFTNSQDGAYPRSALTLSGTNLYGTTYSGGSNGLGTVFVINTNGQNFKILHHFTTNSLDGQNPAAGLVLNGTNLYGATYYGGTNGAGSIFRLSINGTGFINLHSFVTNSTDGMNPSAALTLNGNLLYGTTLLGGNIGGGTVFRLSTNGASYTVLHNFPNTTPTNTDGDFPKAGLLINNNIIYGTAFNSGAGGGGTIFQMNTNGNSFLVLKSFTNAPDGVNPLGQLALNGATLYGTSYYGGAGNFGLVFSLVLSPVIRVQPQDQIVTNGNTFNFTMAADGAPTLNYQWYFQTNALIVGATNAVLSYATADGSLAGTYSVVVTNSYGSVTSSFAILTVVPAATIPSVPVILGFNFNPTNGSFSLSMSNSVASTNRLWATTNLVSTNFWHVIATNVQAANGLWFFTDTNIAKTNAARFYRFSTP